MRTLVHLRHGERQAGHLTDSGARLAGELGQRLPRFDRVLASPKPRAVETAQAMGYSVDGELFVLGALPDEVGRKVDQASPQTFADFLALVAEATVVREHAETLAGVLRAELARLPSGGRLLVVSHGGIVELAAVGALGPATAAWGAVLGYLEGVELLLAANRWSRGAVIRPPH